MPEFASVGAEEERAVFLRGMTEDRFAFLFRVAREKGHGDFNLVERPLLPCAAIEQRFWNLNSLVLELTQNSKGDKRADAVRAVRIGKVVRDENLVRFEFFDKIADALTVFVGGRKFFNGARNIEGEIKKMDVFARYAAGVKRSAIR